jgi:hypothetical protein
MDLVRDRSAIAPGIAISDAFGVSLLHGRDPCGPLGAVLEAATRLAEGVDMSMVVSLNMGLEWKGFSKADPTEWRDSDHEMIRFFKTRRGGDP